MASSRLERAVVVAGACALGVLVWLIIGEWDRFSDRSGPVTVASPVAVQTREVAAESHARVPTAPTGRLTLTAARGDCWLVVRLGSPSGRELFAGILEASRTVSFAGRRFWLSLGAASNLDARFNGKPVRGLPSGTATVTLDGPVARLAG